MQMFYVRVRKLPDGRAVGAVQDGPHGLAWYLLGEDGRTPVYQVHKALLPASTDRHKSETLAWAVSVQDAIRAELAAEAARQTDFRAPDVTGGTITAAPEDAPAIYDTWKVPEKKPGILYLDGVEVGELREIEILSDPASPTRDSHCRMRTRTGAPSAPAALVAKDAVIDALQAELAEARKLAQDGQERVRALESRCRGLARDLEANTAQIARAAELFWGAATGLRELAAATESDLPDVSRAAVTLAGAIDELQRHLSRAGGAA